MICWRAWSRAERRARDHGRPSVCAHTRKTRKTRYDKKGAQSAINKRAGEKNQPATLRAYECKHCHGWHLTHKELKS